MEFQFRVTTSLKKIRSLKKRDGVKKPVHVIQGSSSAGKTLAIIAIMIDKCCKNQGLEMSVISESIPHLKKGALKDFLKIMKSTNRFQKSHYNATERKYTFSTGSYMEFFSPESVLGSRRTHLFINEAINIRFEDYHQLATRTEQEIWIDYNPANQFWVHTEVIPDPDSDFWILTYIDNEACPESIIDDMNKAIVKAETGDPYWINWVKVYVKGEIGMIEGIIYPVFEIFRDLPIQLDNKPAPFEPDCYGLDFGFNHASVLVGVKMIDENNYARQEMFSPGLTSSLMIKRFDELKIRKDRVIYADGSRPEIIRDLQNAGYWVTEAVKDVKDGIDSVQKNKLFIHESSIEGIKQTRNYRWTKKGETYTDEPVKFEDDFPDALRYAIYSHQKKNFKGTTDFRTTNVRR